MANEEQLISDPLGNQVRISAEFCKSTQSVAEGDVYDEALKVIERPAILIESNDQPIPELYYYRSIGWNNTLLIAAKKDNTEWVAYKCTRNAPSSIITELLKKGRQVF